MRRLALSTTDDFERRLLLSARGEAPSADAAHRAIAALAGAAALSASGTAAAATGASVAGKAVASGVVAKSAFAAAVPWVAAGVVAGGAVLGVATQQTRQAENRPEASAVVVSVARQRLPALARPPGSTTASAAAPTADPAVPALPKTSAPQSPPASVLGPPRPESSAVIAATSASAPQVASAPPADTRSEVTAEVRALDRARLAMAAGRSLDALGILDQYGRDFPRGALSLEAEVLRIEACAGSGRGDRAVFLAERFLAAHPRDAHAARVRALLNTLTNR